MRRARKLGTVVLALAVVFAAVYATGAFTSTSADRSADVTVAGDAAAFLALETSEGPNGQFASYGSDGALQVTMGEGSRGVNPGSRTSFQNVFTISNKGAQSVSVWFAGGSKAVAFVGPNGDSIESKGGAVTLRPGGQALHVGLLIDSRGVEPGKNLLQSVEVRTDADVGSGPTKRAKKKEIETPLQATKTKPTNSRPSRGFTGSSNGDGSRSNGQSGGSENDGCGKRLLCYGENFVRGAYGIAAASGDYLAGDLDEATGRKISKAKHAVTNMANGVASFIRGKYSILREHKEELWASATATPGFYDDMIVFAMLNPGMTMNLSLGAGLGAVGMPEGNFPVEEAETPEYFVGWMAGSFVPVADILPDIRDTVQAAVNHNWAETGLGLAAILPGYGKAGDFGQVGTYAAKWVGMGSAQADDLYRMVKSGLLSRLPSNARQKILDKLPGKLTDASSGLRNEVTGSVRQRFDGVDGSRRVVAGSGPVPDEVVSHMDETDDAGLVNDLLNRGITVDNMKYYLKSDIPLDTVSVLRRQKSPSRVDDIVRNYRQYQTRAGKVGRGLSLRTWWCQSETRSKANTSAICKKSRH